MEKSFLALLFRQKFINRWSLMYNTHPESLSTHVLECSLLTHFLCAIGNTYFGKSYESEKLVTYALYHDATEILTGDLPTPIKYHNAELKNAYRNLETLASQKLLTSMPLELQETFEKYFTSSTLTPEENTLIKVADKLCAYIKCKTELNSGNKEFLGAYTSIENNINSMSAHCEELKYFLENYIHIFDMSLDELRANL